MRNVMGRFHSPHITPPAYPVVTLFALLVAVPASRAPRDATATYLTRPAVASHGAVAHDAPPLARPARASVHRTNGYQIGAYYFSGWSHGQNDNLTTFLPRARDWPSLVKTWIAYFKQPDYVRVGGKPPFIVFSPEHMRSDVFGSSARVRQALNYLRSQAVRAHLPGVTVAVGATLVPHYNPGRIGQLLSEGYDVTTGYNYHAMGNEQYRKPVPYRYLVQENQQMWDRVASKIDLPYIIARRGEARDCSISPGRRPRRERTLAGGGGRRPHAARLSDRSLRLRRANASAVTGGRISACRSRLCSSTSHARL